jgi:hypothetical protein
MGAWAIHSATRMPSLAAGVVRLAKPRFRRGSGGRRLGLAILTTEQ